MFYKALIQFNNFLTRLRRSKRVAPENLLLLLPHCLQCEQCNENITRDIANCKRCGKCPIKVLAELTDKYGIRCVAVGGGRQATAAVKQKETKAVIAVACNKELVAGVLATLPKPVLALPNSRPCGYCRNTTVDAKKVEAAIKALLAEDQG